MSRAAAREGKVWYESAPGEKPIQIPYGQAIVFLNGEEEPAAIDADEEKGEVVVAVEDERLKSKMIPGWIIDPFSPYGVKTETKRGRVEIRLTEEAREVVDSLRKVPPCL